MVLRQSFMLVDVGAGDGFNAQGENHQNIVSILEDQ